RLPIARVMASNSLYERPAPIKPTPRRPQSPIVPPQANIFRGAQWFEIHLLSVPEAQHFQLSRPAPDWFMLRQKFVGIERERCFGRLKTSVALLCAMINSPETPRCLSALNYRVLSIDARDIT